MWNPLLDQSEHQSFTKIDKVGSREKVLADLFEKSFRQRSHEWINLWSIPQRLRISSFCFLETTRHMEDHKPRTRKAPSFSVYPSQKQYLEHLVHWRHHQKNYSWDSIFNTFILPPTQWLILAMKLIVVLRRKKMRVVR